MNLPARQAGEPRKHVGYLPAIARKSLCAMGLANIRSIFSASAIVTV